MSDCTCRSQSDKHHHECPLAEPCLCPPGRCAKLCYTGPVGICRDRCPTYERVQAAESRYNAEMAARTPSPHTCEMGTAAPCAACDAIRAAVLAAGPLASPPPLCGFEKDGQVCARLAGHSTLHRTAEFMALLAEFDAATPAGETTDARDDRADEFNKKHGLNVAR